MADPLPVSPNGPGRSVSGYDFQRRGHHHFRAASRRGLLLSLAIVGLFLVVEAVGGWLTNSLALLADAGHLLTDVGTIVLALLAIWVGSRPASFGRTYGYYRAEIFAALISGLTLWLVAGYISFEAFRRMQSPPEVNSLPMVLIASVGFVAQAGAAYVLHRASGESLNVRAAFVHVMTDAVQSVGVVVAGLFMLVFQWYIADPIISFIIAILIVWSGGKVAWDASKILMESSPIGIDMDLLCQRVEQIEGVTGVHDIHAWTITTGYNVLSAHVTTVSNAVKDSEKLLHLIRGTVDREFGISHVTIQLEDSAEGCEEGHHVSHP